MLESLRFPEIHSRQERIHDAHAKTFQWIYAPKNSDKGEQSWDNFVEWLENGQGVYWINGKAGSGKSTLMSYLSHDYRTSSSLKKWSGTRDILTPSFFFWNAGTQMEKSTEGILRSLVYQVLEKYPTLISLIGDVSSHENGLTYCGSIPVWTERRLRAISQTAMAQTQRKARICIFIDGLDELSGDQEALITLIENVQTQDVKLCLSSRPHRSYNEAFEASHKLRLQDLTEPDIKTYVSDKMPRLAQNGSVGEVRRLFDDIVRKAEGVFLWVELVVKDLTRGLKHDDTLEQLRIRVESTPSDLEALYEKMLSSIELAHHEEAAQLFQMALSNLTRSLLDVALELNKGFDRLSEIRVGDALAFCCRFRKRIPAIGAGLLELNFENNRSSKRVALVERGNLTLPIHYTYSLEAADVSFYERYAHVDFIHRTAAEFLRQNKQAQIFLDSNVQSSLSPHCKYVRVLLTKLSLLGFPQEPPEIDAESAEVYTCLGNRHPDDDFVDQVARPFIYKIMQHVFLDELETGIAQVSLCYDVDRILTAAYQRHGTIITAQHWSTRWGSEFGSCGESSQADLWFPKNPKTSPPTSFCSAKTGSQLFSNRPVDFVGEAACWALSSYVLGMVDMQQKPLERNYVNYLLYCAVCAVNDGRTLPKSLNLLTELLRRGGDPNMYTEDSSITVWRLFLERIQWYAHRQSAALVAITKLFLDKGADVHMRVRTLWRESRHLTGEEGSCWRSLGNFLAEDSPLYRLRATFGYLSEFENLEDIILVKGGRDFRRFVQVRFGDNRTPRKVSERQSKKMLATLNEMELGCGAPMPLRRRRERRLDGLFKEIWEENEDCGSEMSSTESETSGTDTEDVFYESVAVQTEAEIEDCEPIVIND